MKNIFSKLLVVQFLEKIICLYFKSKIGALTRLWHCTPLIPALWREREADLHDFEVGLVYRVSSRTISEVTQKNSVSRKAMIYYNYNYKNSKVVIKIWGFV